jgi:hypothetical protein
MALTPGPVGRAIADYFVNSKPADGSAITEADLEAIWVGVMTLIYNDIKASAVVNTTDVGTVTSGSGAGGNTAGTGTGTIT